MSRVRDILDAKGERVLTVDPHTPVARVAQRMRAEQIGAFVVSVDGHRLDGLVVERDIVFGLARYGPEVLDMPTSAVMTRAVITCRPDDTVRSAMTAMTRSRVRHLPVVERGHLRGIISIGDLVKACIDDADLEANVIRDAYLVQRARLTTTT